MVIVFEEHMVMETKICTSCKTEKPLSEFHRFGSGGAQIGKWCEACYTTKIAGKPAVASKKAAAKPS